jgi:radical SAM protein with 4Fe4S-binding SPASM domain
MTFPEIRDTVREISGTLDVWKERYGIHFSPGVNISGGEPFLRSDIFKIIGEFRSYDFEIYVLTNGTLIDKYKAEKLRDHGVNGVQVSIEGPEYVHESIRGRKSFSSSVKGIRNLLGAGLEVTLNVTLSRLNAGFMADLIQLSSGLGVQSLGFSRLVPSGRGKAMKKEMLSAKKVEGLYRKLFSFETNGLRLVTGDPVASQSREKPGGGDRGSVALGGCAAGISGITILPDGTLLPCRRLPVPIGNVRKDSLREVWALSEVLNALRDRSMYKGKCGSCRRWAECRGCRAIAYAFSGDKEGQGDFLAQDPQCFLNEN